MKSPLKKYREVASKFGISAEYNLEVVGMLSFAREQAIQMQHIVNRLLFDITTSYLRMEDSKDDSTKAAYLKKANEYESDLRQTKAALDVALPFIKELEDLVEAEA